ncbi:MAG: hypothetical protein E2O77_11880, partial [Caldithrix sp.]
MSDNLEQHFFSKQAGFEAALGTFEERVETAFKDLKENQIIARIWNLDHTVWKAEPMEISNRLGWLDSPESMLDNIAEIEAFVEEIR